MGNGYTLYIFFHFPYGDMFCDFLFDHLKLEPFQKRGSAVKIKKKKKIAS